MAIRNLPLSSLEVNAANDRHGELENETAAIAWLFNERELHMRNLAKDIVDRCEIYEFPLVAAEGRKFVVYDGNRRVTCLKLLEDPKRAPSTDLQNFFREQRARWEGTFPTSFQCQVETDRDRIDEILYRRHTGAQGGIGQSTWDDRMKATFVARTGKGNGPSIADEIEKRLEAAHMRPARRKIPRSTLNRLLSAEAFRNRVGVSMKGGKFEFTRDEQKSLKALARIASDLASKTKTLNDVWAVDDKQRYLDELEREGVLPTASDVKVPSTAAKDASKPAKVKPSAKVTATPRINLIPRKDFGLTWPGRLQRHHQIWEELQFHLELSKHPNAISVLMRVLIELAIENYIAQAGVTIHENDKLAKRLEKVGLHLKVAGKIDGKQMDVIKKFQQGDKLISADTLNRYVHSPNFAPSPEHLTSVWDSLANVVVLCLKA